MQSSSIIPYFHFDHPLDKMKAEWCLKAIDYYYKHNTNNVSLLHGKNVERIEQYYDGNFDMAAFIRMYKSSAKALTDQIAKNNPGMFINKDISEVEAEPLPLISSKVKSAESLIAKTPIEITCKALDGLAMKKKEEDINFLVAKPALEEDLQPFADQMQLGKVDLGKTKNSDVELGDNPYGLDLQDPDQKKIFSLLYSLNVETSFEKVLQIFYELKKIRQIRLLEIRDQYKYGVSTHETFISSITGLLDAEYVFPGELYVQESDLPDFGDNHMRYRDRQMSVMDMYNRFSEDIGSFEALENILNGDGGYCTSNGCETYHRKDYTTKKVNFVLMQVRSLDWVGIYEKPKSKRGTMSFTMDEKKANGGKIWAQNTYQFWWLKGTDKVFGISKLDGAHRTKGLETHQNFSWNIYRSQKRSAVELSIGENRKAQIAEIKMFHAIAVSLPPGRVIDIKGMRNALEGLDDESNSYTLDDLLNMALKRNIQIIDSTDFEGKNDGQLKPFYEVPGGIRTDVNGYMQVIQQCAANISKFTGINDQLTGQASEELVGNNKLLLNAGVNALHHISEAIETQYQAMMNSWGILVQKAIESGGKSKKALINLIGADDVKLLDGLDETPLHNLTIKVSLTQRSAETEAYNRRIEMLIAQGLITLGDEMLLNQISNPKERLRFLVTKENLARKEANKQKELDRQAVMQRQEMVNAGLVEKEAAKTEGNIKEIYADGEVKAKLLQMAESLGMRRDQVQFIGKKALQQDRGEDQRTKEVAKIKEKEESRLRSPLPFV